MPTDLHNVESQVDDQVVRECVTFVETQPNRAVFEPRKIRSAGQGGLLDVALTERRSAASGGGGDGFPCNVDDGGARNLLAPESLPSGREE